MENDIQKIEESKNCLDNISNSNSEISQDNFYCKICKQHKNKEHFYTFNKSIEDKILDTQYINYLCKDCLPIEAIYLSKEKPKINQNILSKHFYQKQLEKLKIEQNLTLNDIISRAETKRQLRLRDDDKKWLNQKLEMGIIHEIRICYSPGNYEERNNKNMRPEYHIYYRKSEFEILKMIKNDGYIQLRSKRSIKDGAKLESNPPFLYNTEDKEYLFINLKESKKPCSRCLKIKNFSEFYELEGTRDKKSTTCKECNKLEAKERYGNLSKDEKMAFQKNVKTWKRNNKERVKFLTKEWNKNNPEKVKKRRKRRAGLIQNKIRRNLKARLKMLLKAKKYNNIDYLQKIKDGTYILPASEKLLGIHPIKFLEYLESKFLPGMSWQNYGSGKDKWEIDHIKCIDSFDLTKEENLMAVNYYTNLLPMWAEDNYYKSNKIELHPIRDKWLLDKYKDLNILIKKDTISNDKTT